MRESVRSGGRKGREATTRALRAVIELPAATLLSILYCPIKEENRIHLSNMWNENVVIAKILN